MSLVDRKMSRNRKNWLARSLKIIHRAPWGCGADTLHPSLQVSTLSFHWVLGQLPVVFTVFDIKLAVWLRTVQYVLRNGRLSRLCSNPVCSWGPTLCADSNWAFFCLCYCTLHNASTNPSDLLWRYLARLRNVTFFQNPKQLFIVSLRISFYSKFSATQRDW